MKSSFDHESTTRALVVHPYLYGAPSARRPQAALKEGLALASAISLHIVGGELIRLNKPQPSTLLGSGNVDTLGQRIKAESIGLVIVDHSLSPVQQRNLEKAWNTKVIDRTGLILEIFGQRARTREGQLQVELAALTYQRSRLVRSWTHLERQRGGFGFLGGPGESQLEIDRRLIDNRILRIKADLEDVRRTRGIQRAARQRVPFPVVALVGYTNAGKSTLFNTLTKADVLAKDQLFATLDPTMRAIPLLGKRKAILSDTVGFISDLPTMLVAAFRATLEEVQSADLILHVRDISHPDAQAQRQDVEQVLGDLGIDWASDPRLIEVWNKVDLLDEEALARLRHQQEKSPHSVAVSALTGQGIDELREVIDRFFEEKRVEADLELSLADGAALAWLYEKGRVLERKDVEDKTYLRVSMDPADLARFHKRSSQS